MIINKNNLIKKKMDLIGHAQVGYINLSQIKIESKYVICSMFLFCSKTFGTVAILKNEKNKEKKM
jgi:hypothetical protein